MSMRKDRGQIKYISGLRVSKAVITNYEKGRYSDETLINHLVKHNKEREPMMNLREGSSFEDHLKARIERYRDLEMDNKEIVEAIFSEHRSVTAWTDENQSYFASLEETYRQIPESEKRKIKRQFGDINWDAAIYDTNTGQTIIPGANGNLILNIKDHRAGEYDEESLSWSVKK